MPGSRSKSETESKVASAGYSGTPLPKKLGIGRDYKVQLIGAPSDFEKSLGDLGEGARLVRRTLKSVCQNPQESDLALWFVDSAADLEIGVKHFSQHCPRSGVWVIWRKKSALRSADPERALTENQIRDAALPLGLVDFKVCAFDATWSGLKLTKRKTVRDH